MIVVPAGAYHFDPPPPDDSPTWSLRLRTKGGDDRRFPFAKQLEIGRYQAGGDAPPGTLLIDDPTVSRRHCVLTRTAEAQCVLRDTSSNGTWVDGRRLVPGIEVEIQSGQVIRLGKDHLFELEAGASTVRETDSAADSSTVRFSSITTVTVLVGDIRDYTLLVRKVPPEDLQQSVSRVFQRLERTVAELGGTIKEYPGDAIFAFWEHRSKANQAAAACRAALALRELAARLAAESSVWCIREFPLKMDWALATGPVVIGSMGGTRPTGLSMVGEPVVLAFRIEKLADDRTGPILACEQTAQLVGDAFVTRDLGPIDPKGFETSKRIYAILGTRGANGG